MGFAGFSDIYRNRGKLLTEISEARRNNILANKPSSATWIRVSDWWNYFEKKFYNIYNEHTTTTSLKPLQASFLPDISAIKETVKENKIIVGGIVVVVGVVSIYFIYKNRRKNKR